MDRASYARADVLRLAADLEELATLDYGVFTEAMAAIQALLLDRVPESRVGADLRESHKTALTGEGES